MREIDFTRVTQDYKETKPQRLQRTRYKYRETRYKVTKEDLGDTTKHKIHEWYNYEQRETNTNLVTWFVQEIKMLQVEEFTNTSSQHTQQ